MGKLLYIETIIHDLPESVFKALTKPEAIKKWNFASEDWHCPFAEVDLKVGGIQNTRMESKDGSIGFDFILTFKQIEENKRLSMQMEDGRYWDIQLTKVENGTLVQEFFEAEDENSEELQLGGWNSILNSLKLYVENN